MTNRDAWIMTLTQALAGGGLLGALYFGGLWWTVRRGLVSVHPGYWFFGGIILRLGLAMAGFFLASRHGAGALLACLLGFVAARMAVVRVTRPGLPALKAGHAP